MSTPLQAGEASIWAQPDGPNTKPQYMGCHEVGDVTEPLGDMTNIYCPDPAQAGKFKAVGSYQGEPGAITTTLTGVLYKEADALEAINCPFNLIINSTTCGRRDLFTNRDRATILRGSRATQRTYTNLAVRTPGANGESTLAIDISAEELVRIYNLTSGRQDVGATGALMGLTFCSSAYCAGECGPTSQVCEFGVVVGPNPAASAAEAGEIWYTEDGGATWTQTATHPFAAGEDISAVVCFPVGRSTTRIIVARGAADAGNPAEIAYSDDNGTTWTLVNVGSTNGQFVTDGEGLFALDPYHIWLCTNDGYIYISEDSGLTWTAQEEGVLTSAPWNAIEFVDESNGWVVGDNAEIAKTNDGGTTWTAVTPPVGEAADEIEALAVIDKNTVWTGWSDGVVYYTKNGGTDWYARSVPGSLAIVNDIDFQSDLIGWLVGNTSAPVGKIFRTIDGGYTWEEVTGLPTNVGLSMIHSCDNNTAFAVGPASGGTGVIIKVFAQS